MCSHLRGCLLKALMGSSAVMLKRFAAPLFPTSCALLMTLGVGLSFSFGLSFILRRSLDLSVYIKGLLRSAVHILQAL